MAQTSRTFRIFVSSTFSDLKAERNALQQYVFPRLRELAISQGCHFQAIDLRWGVSEEAALDQQTMKICLGEIERCQKTSPRPNFIVLLGDRYGWRPLPAEIPADEFEKIILLIAGEERSLLEQWYRRDDNAVPPVYLLQPRAEEFVEYENWEKVETQLRQVFLSAVGRLSISSDDLLKYSASATEQEIFAGALKVPDASEHVFCFLRDIQGLPEDASAAAFCETDPQATRQQSELKARLRQSLAGNVHEYTARWQSNGTSQEHLDQLCEDVYSELSKVILAEVGLLETVEPLEQEITAHEVFGKDRARVFIGRVDILKAIEKHIAGSDPQPLAVWGASGSGKSALIAKAVEQAQKNGQDVLYRFIGATPESSNGRALLESLCKQVSRRYGADESTIPTEYKDLVQEFPKRLALAKPGKPLVIFLDALDQLSDTDNARSLVWLPAELPPNARLIISTLPGDCLQALESKLCAEHRMEVQPMSVQEGKNILTEWLSGVNRQLKKKQEEHLLDKFQRCGLPLYLKLAFEEARLWKSYDALPELSEDIPGILRDLFGRLSKEANHGKMLVSRSLGYLVASKNGLSEDELLDVLSLDQEIITDFRRRSPKSPEIDRLPVVVWSRLYFDLEPYLAERSADETTLLAFYHRQMTEACQAAYREPARHAGLAAYFTARPLYIDKDQQAPNLRKTSEQAYQQRNGEMWGELYTTLTDFDFLESRCRAASVYDLESDYLLALQGWQGQNQNIVQTFEERFRLESHAINKIPELLFPQLYNNLTWLDAPDGPIHATCERSAKQHHAWLRMTQDPRPQPPPWLLSIEGPGAVHAVAITPDGKQIVSGSKELKIWDITTGRLLRSLEGHARGIWAVAITPDGKQIVSASRDKTLKVWDLQSGRLTRSLEGHKNEVVAVAITPDGKRAISGSWDCTLKVWDLADGRLLRTLDTYTSSAYSLAITPDGKQIVSSEAEKTIKVWDLESGRLLRSLEGHTERVEAVTITADGKKVVSGSQDKTLKIWDFQSGRLLRSLEGHTNQIVAVVVTPDGKQIVSSAALGDETIRVWDLESGRLLRSLKGHTNQVHALSVTPDGSQVVSGSEDSTIRVWDIQSGRLICSLEGPGWVNAIAITPDGAQVVSGSADKTIKVWDLDSGRLLRAMVGHTGWVNAIAITPDGAQVVSGSTDKTIKVWDLKKGNLLRSMEGHTDKVDDVAITPDSKQVISSSRDHTIKVWDLKRGRLLRSMEGHKGWVNAVAVPPNGKQVISGSKDMTLKIWDLKRGRLLRSLEGHTDQVTAVAITRDGKQIVSGSHDRTIKIWDFQSGRLLRSLEGHTDQVTAVAITRDGKQIVSGSEDLTLKIWDITSGGLLLSLAGQLGSVLAVAVTPDGKRVVSGTSNSGIKVWDIESTLMIRSLEGHSADAFAVAITPDGAQVVSSSYDKTIKVWDLKSGRLIRSLEGHTRPVSSVVVTPDGKQVVSSGSFDNTVKVWNLQSGRLLHSWEGGIAEGRIGHVGAVMITPDGKQAVSSGSFDHTVRVWDLQSGRLTRSLEGHEGSVNAVAFTPDGTQVISGSKDTTIRVWDLQSGREIRWVAGNIGAVTAVALSPDGAQVVSVTSNKIKIWDFQSGRLLRSLEGHTDQVTAVAITRDGKQIVSSSNDRTIRLWDLASGKGKTLYQNQSLIHSISTNEQWLVCGDEKGHVWVFEWVK